MSHKCKLPFHCRMFSSTREALTYEFYQTPAEYFQMPLILMCRNIKTYRRDRVKLLVWEVFLSAPLGYPFNYWLGFKRWMLSLQSSFKLFWIWTETFVAWQTFDLLIQDYFCFSWDAENNAMDFTTELNQIVTTEYINNEPQMKLLISQYQIFRDQ